MIRFIRGTSSFGSFTHRLRSFSAALRVAAVVAAAGTGGCIGARFDAARPAPQLDNPTRAIFDRIAAERASKNLPVATWVEDLRPVAARGALAVARGDLSLVAATNEAAQAGVTAMGRHVFAFGADCVDPKGYRPPAAAAQKTLLYATAAAPGAAGHVYVVLMIADPGTSALRADQMGGGRGGSNPILQSYAHPVVANGPCGDSWPKPPSINF